MKSGIPYAELSIGRKPAFIDSSFDVMMAPRTFDDHDVRHVCNGL
jgi:hypothetical protein